MAERISALDGHFEAGRFGERGEPGVTVREVREPVLHQIAGWPQTIDTLAVQVARSAGADAAPGPCRASVGSLGVLLRVEPLKWWLFGAQAPDLDPEQGVALDLSHSRIHLRLSGPHARACLNRLMPIDLRDQSFPAGAVAATAMHHVGVVVWHSEDGFELFLPRGFAVSLWEVLFQTAVQFGVKIE